MRLFLFVALFAALATVVFAWTKEDHEIFDIVSALEASEGPGTTFYSWLDVPPTASLAEINKAYRKKSMQLHPDKNPGVKGIQERFARLGIIANILRSSEGRKRYDFFYKNGVPKWRGTGYYYSRFRPGLAMVLMFLVILTSGLQYLVQKVNYRRDLEKVRKTMQDARLAAWGPKMMPLEGRRKVKVNLGGGPRIDEGGNIMAGKMVDMVVDGNGIYLCDGAEVHLLDETSAIPPAISRTWFVSLVGGLVRRKPSDKEVVEESEEGSESGGGGADTAVGEPARRAFVSKVGGRRRRARAGK
ncbi:DnaJ-domain-containing protein [Imleria badia]|nr:DnaJ-domain-containing protein [Imleria badia]